MQARIEAMVSRQRNTADPYKRMPLEPKFNGKPKPAVCIEEEIDRTTGTVTYRQYSQAGISEVQPETATFTTKTTPQKTHRYKSLTGISGPNGTPYKMTERAYGMKILDSSSGSEGFTDESDFDSSDESDDVTRSLFFLSPHKDKKRKLEIDSKHLDGLKDSALFHGKNGTSQYMRPNSHITTFFLQDRQANCGVILFEK